MKKPPSHHVNHPKEMTDSIEKHKKFTLEYKNLEKQCTSLKIGCDKQVAEINRIAKKVTVAYRKIEEQEKEIERLKNYFGKFLP